MKFFYSLSILFLLLVGCGTESSKDSTYTKVEYTIVNARLLSSSKKLSVKFEANSESLKSSSVAYIASEDIEVSWEDNSSKRVYISQDFNEINASIEALKTEQKTIYVSVGNSNDTAVPLISLLGPTQDDLSPTNSVIKVLHAANLDANRKVVVKVEPSKLDTGVMEYRDATPSWREIDRGTNILFNVLDEQNFILNGGQDTFVLEAKKAYLLVIYESAESEDTPFVILVDVTPN